MRESPLACCRQSFPFHSLQQVCSSTIVSRFQFSSALFGQSSYVSIVSCKPCFPRVQRSDHHFPGLPRDPGCTGRTHSCRTSAPGREADALTHCGGTDRSIQSGGPTCSFSTSPSITGGSRRVCGQQRWLRHMLKPGVVRELFLAMWPPRPAPWPSQILSEP